MASDKFTVQVIEITITEESAKDGDYASVDEGTVEPTDLRGALNALDMECWDSLDDRGDGTLICYPADSHQDMYTGDYEQTQVIIKAERPERIERLLKCYAAKA